MRHDGLSVVLGLVAGNHIRSTRQGGRGVMPCRVFSTQTSHLIRHIASIVALTALLVAGAGASTGLAFAAASKAHPSSSRVRVGGRARIKHVTSTARPHAKRHFSTVRSIKLSKRALRRVANLSRPTTTAQLHAEALSGNQLGTITFSEFPDGTSITNQYQPSGIDFGGDSPFITQDGANPTSPVLSGSPLFFGTITGTFVNPDGSPRTVDNFSLDVGFIDTPGSTEVVAFGSGGNTIDTVPIEDTGIVNVSVAVSGIASFAVEPVDPGNPDPAGWAIDNVTFPGYVFFAGPPSVSEQGGGPNESERGTTCYVLEPVNCATGVLADQFTDVSVPGRGMPLSLSRSYGSAAASTDGPFGFGWTDSYNVSLSTDQFGDVTIEQEDGSSVPFSPNGSGGFIAPDRVLATLVRNPDGSYTFRRNASQDSYTFTAAGQLASETDRNGYTTTLSYTGGNLTTVTDQAGRTLTFSYAGSHIASVTDPMGRTWTYSYAGGDLTSATDPLGRTWSFTYDSNHLLLTVTNPRGGLTTNTYNNQDQIASQTDANGRTTTWTYSGDPTSVAGGTTTMTDPAGNVTVYDYSTLELTSVTTAFGTQSAATTSYTYDPMTLGVVSVTDPNGNVTTNSYDSSGNLLSTTDPLGNVTSYTYNSFNEVLTKTSPMGETTTSTYDSHGNVLTVTDALGNTTTSAYADPSEPGDLTSVTNPDGNVVTYTYDANGDMASKSTSPSAGVTDTTEYVYDADGERTCQASPNATKANVSCPPPGSPVVAGTTATTYDADGEVTSVTNPNGGTASYGYDGNGNEVKLTDVGGHVTTFAYDGDNRLTDVTKPDGDTLVSTYDAIGDQLSQSNGAGAVIHYTYDALGNVTSSTTPDGHTTSYGYDLDGNRVSLTNPSGAVTSYSYDAGNELIEVDYSDGTTPSVGYSYDGDGQRVAMSDGTGTTSYSYDAADRLVSVTNGAGATTSYGYDPAGLLTAVTYPNGQNVTRGYDGVGQLTSVGDWLGHTTKFSYDADGNLVTQADPNGVTARSTFDSNDQLKSITDNTPATTLASFTYTRNNLGQVTGVTETGAVSTHQVYAYTALGQLASDSAGTFSYSSAGGLTTMPGGVTQAFNADGELTSSSRPVPPAAPVADQVRSANEKSHLGALTSPAVSTKAAGELVLAFISADGPVASSQRITSVTGGRLTWSLAARSNKQQGTAEVWQARATKKLSAAKVTAKLARAGYDGSITIATFTGAGKTVGAHATASRAKGAPSVSITTTGVNSLIWAAGQDPRHAKSRTTAAGQLLVRQFLDTAHPGTFWSQKTAGAISTAHRTVKIADKSPTTDKWDMAAVEITSGGPGTAKTTYAYDPAGNLTAIKPTGHPVTGLTYDQANRLTGYGSAATYSYDGDGLMMSQAAGSATVSFAWDQSGSVPVLIQAGTVDYVYGPDNRPIEQIAGSTVTYLLSDQQGSTRLLTDSSGTVVGTYSYGPYGNVTRHTGTATTALRYNGEYTDAASGTQYLQARFYNPATTQFLTADPLTSATGQPYQYAGGSPLTFSDASGMLALPCSVTGALSGDLGDLDVLNEILTHLAELPKNAATILSALLRSGDTPEIRSFAASLLPKVGALSKTDILVAIRTYAPVAGFALNFGEDIFEGQSLGSALLESGGGAAGGAVGGTAGEAAGGFLCGLAAVDTLGLGAATCPVLIASGGVIGSAVGGWIGGKVGSFLARL